MADAEHAEPVFRLIYRSHSRIAAAGRRQELGAIFSVARSSNKKLGVTGALLITDDQFVQALEGPEPVVRALYEHIGEDVRHDGVELLETADAVQRIFGRWSMAKVAADGEPDIPLLTNRDKGGISPAQPRAATAAQQDFIEHMHDSLRRAESAHAAE